MWKAWKATKQFLHYSRSKFLFLTFLSLINGLFEATLLVLISRIVLGASGGGTDSDTTDQDFSWFPWLGDNLVLVCGLLAISLIPLHALHVGVSASVAARVLVNSRRRLVASYLRSPWEAFSPTKQSKLIDRVTQLSTHTSMLSTTLLTAISALLGLLVYLAAAMALQPQISLALGVLGGLFYLLFRPLVRLTQRYSREYLRQNRSFVTTTSSLTSMDIDLRVYGVLEAAIEEVDRANRRAGSSLRTMRFLSRFSTHVYRDLSLGLVVSIIALMQAIGTNEVQTLAPIIVLGLRMLTYASALNSNIQLISEQLPSAIEVSRNLSPAIPGDSTKDQSRTAPEFATLEVSDLTYLSTDAARILDSVSLRLERNTITCLTGPSGGGKTTLSQLILGLRRPTSGKIVLNGDNAATPLSLYQSDIPVAIVPQDPVILEDTILNNVRLFRQEVTRQDVSRALEVAQLGDWLRSTQSNLDTVVGGSSSAMSGGERQRLALARAVAGEPEFLVLDEPTSALDDETEATIVRNLSRLENTTILAITHRPRLLEICDQALVVNQSVSNLAKESDQLVELNECSSPALSNEAGTSP